MIFLELFLSFFKVGLFCFGGGYGMLPLMEETVVAKGWLTAEQFYDFVGVCESTPGPIAVNMATYVGSVTGGPLGSIVATLGTVLPAFIIILIIASILKNFTENKYFKGFLKGVKPVVSALILSTGTVLLANALGFFFTPAFTPDLRSMVIFPLLLGIYFAVKKLWKKKLSSIWLIAISACLGIAVCSVAELL
ncbi:MAG: chromate transporter [Clostridia bacterium]|nr:chromate transporter [Clostridia bacterium]